MAFCRSTVAIVAAVLLAGLTTPAAAQVQRGSVYGSLQDNTGAVLPGANIQLTADVMAPMDTISGPRGEFRFQGLDPGRYTMKVTLQGFVPYTRSNIIVGVGTNVELPAVRMTVAGVQEEIAVSAASPVLDSRAHGNREDFDRATLEEVPTARDPWVLLQSVPGVLLDRVNVGGSESGQQSNLSARGDDGSNTMWNLDGVTITDAGAIGSSPTYYDFNAFEEVQFTTGGTDARQQTGGLGINFVTKRGTNAYHGLGRIYFTNDGLQGENIPADLAAQGFAGNRIKQIAEYGGDLGGPIVNDKLWFWAAAAKNDIKDRAITGFPDNTVLNNYSAKVDAQLSEQNHFNFFYYRGEKVKTGRDAGVTRPPETSWNQGGPTSIYKFDDSHVFGPNLFLSGKYAHVASGFFLYPQGGLNAQVYQDLGAGGIWHNSFEDVSTKRPQDQANVDGSWFRGSHELKFGFQYRRTPVSSVTRWPGTGTYAIAGLQVIGLPPGFGWAELTREGRPSSILRTTSGYANDVITTGEWTLNLGVRVDRQNGTNQPTDNAANALAPSIVPAMNYPGGGPDFTWNDWSPRVGVTRRLGEKTIARASYARFAEQLRSSYVTFDNPSGISDIEYYFFDANGDHIPQAGELLYATGSAYNIDPSNPAAPVSPNQVDKNLKAPITQSIVFGLDRELRPNFALSTSLGYDYITDTIWAPYIGLTQSDFVQYRTAGLAGGVTSNTPVYRVGPNSSLPPGNGQILTNRPGYHQRAWNWDVTATKRLADNWMFRGYLTLQNLQEFFDDPSVAIQDPTPRLYNGTNGGPLFLGYGAQQNGGIVVNNIGLVSGAKSDVFIQAKWSYSLMGLYQFKWGISASGTLYGRQGYPNPEYVAVSRPGLGSTTAVLTNTDLDSVRNPNLNMLDLRASKKLDFQKINATIDVDLFNALNVSTVLQQTRQANSSNFRIPREIVGPRILRFGVRLQF